MDKDKPGADGEAGQETRDPVARTAKASFHVDYLFPLQRLVIANILDTASLPEDGTAGEADSGAEGDYGRLRQAALLPTGFGKSLCFQLPALLLPGPTIAVYPLLALMEDQRRRLEALGLACALFRGGQDEGERKAAEAAVASGRAKIVITNPESLKGRLLDFLAELAPSHVAIDEAHCVSEWGETFRPAYLELGTALAKLDPPAATAFTATASPLVLEAMSRILFGGEACRLVEGDPDRPNIVYEVRRGLARERVLELALRECARPAIVFASSRSGVEILAERLRRRLGSDAIRFYHAGLEAAEKRALEEWFLASRDGILVSTCAYGMGVDKRDIRTVIHADLPPSVEAYLQESGRAGRDGGEARAILLSGPEDARGLEREADPARRERRAAFLAYALESKRCRREALLAMLGAELRSPCSGCDVCAGRASGEIEGADEIRRFVRANPRRFGIEEAVRLLLGRGGEPPSCSGSGSLADWRREDVLAAVAAASRTGLVVRREKGPWKGRLDSCTPARQVEKEARERTIARQEARTRDF